MTDSYVKDLRAKLLRDTWVLEPLVESGPVQAYYLKVPGQGRIDSVLLLFTPEGIAIQGDITPSHHGDTLGPDRVSSFKCHLEWFAKDLSEDYLCSKFLSKVWVREYAEQELRDPNGCWQEGLREDPEQMESFQEILDNLDEHGEEWLYHELTEAGFVVDDGVPGRGYEPHAAGWLCAIQQAFARLWREQHAQATQA